MQKEFKKLPNNPTKKWFKQITDHYITTARTDDVRDINDIIENYNLVRGMMNTDFFNKQLNPLDLPQAKNDIPIKEEIIPVILPSINTLIGEIYDRPIDFRAYVANPEAVSDKERWLKSEFAKRLDNIIKDTSLSEEETKLKLIELQQWKQYDSQDIRERFANHLLKDHIERLHFQQKTKEGWKDMIINSQEIYRFDLVEGNVIFEKVNPADLTIYGLPETGEVHKAEAIVYNRYMTIGDIIATYGKELSKKEIDKIIEGESGGHENLGIVMVMNKIFDDGELNLEEKEVEPLEYDTDKNEFLQNNDRVNNKILIRTVYFKVLREVKELHYINETTGQEEIKIVDYNYEENEDMGEWSEKRYINEWWESTKIFNDIYVNQKQCEVQMRDMNNPSIVLAPIVGKIQMIGNKQAKSVVDLLKPIQYQWTIFSKKMMLLWSRNYGKLVRIDISKIPKKYGFDVDLFMSWITSFGIIVEDPFNEAMKGQPAGQFSSSVQAVDMELSSSISQALQYMVYLRQLADEMVGVNRQRRGDLMASDGLGTTQESINRSLKITEEMFQEHHELQKTLLHYMLEYGKHALQSGQDKKFQYITDGAIYTLYEANPELFRDVDYGIFINNTRKQMQLEQVFLQLAHAYAQNGAIDMSEIMDLYNTQSMSERINKLRLKEKEMKLNQEKMEKMKQEHEQQLMQMQQQFEQMKMQHELELQKLKNEGLIMVAQIQAQSKIDAEEIKAAVDLEEAGIKSSTEHLKSLYQYKTAKENKNKTNNK